MSSDNGGPTGKYYLRLGGRFFLKSLEMPCVYDVENDELYELSPQAMELLSRCDGTHTAEELEPEEDFLAYCLEEEVLEVLDRPGRRVIVVGRNENPSLRYLMVEVTDRCNLRCRHCYLGGVGTADLEWETARRIIEDFDDMGGLRLMVTGGEPLLYPHFELLNRELAQRSFRAVLISNGTLMEGIDLRGLNFREIQYSLDGLEEGHDFLRGGGSYGNAFKALRRTLQAGIDVSVATVIHSRNLHELERLGEILFEMDVRSWTLEYPVEWGRMRENCELMPDLEAAAPLFEMEWGWGAHEGSPGYACGAHLANVEPGGRLVKCGYYREEDGGEAGAEGGLRRAWLELPKMHLAGSCAECDVLAECGGGCRFRAELMAGPGGPDPLMCVRMGKPWRRR
ncbi:MAG: radical SAM protein [Actinomycetota bacterium]|nr:radical SAM protein [Actinomycetota bacterium]